MPPQIFRTHHTPLSDDELLILDVMFCYGVTYPMLRQRRFVQTFNARSHSFSDDELKETLRHLVRDGIIELTADRWRGHRYVRMTSDGGALWAAERRPNWDRYCTERYSEIIRGRTLMSVRAVTASIRDDFLERFIKYPARFKRATISDNGLIPWREFGVVHVGLATYVEPSEWSCTEYESWVEQERQHVAQMESNRTWWRTVRELQKFVGT